MIRSRLIYLVLLITAFVFSQALYDSISLFTLAVVLLIPLISLICLGISLALVKITPDPVTTRESRLRDFSFGITIKSKTPVMLPMMKFNLQVSNEEGDQAIPGYSVANYRAFGTTRLEIPVKFTVRGLYKIGVESVVFYDFLKLFSVKKKLNKTDVVVITPRQIHLELPVQTSRQEQENTVTVGGHENKYSGDVAGIREFNEYDTLRQVHWKLSARLSKMIVKTFWENSCDNIMVLADLFPYEEELLLNRRLTDCVIEIALEATSGLAEEGIRTMLGYPAYNTMLHCHTITTPEEQVAASDEFAMTPMMSAGSLEETAAELDAQALQGGALYIITSMPVDKIAERLEPYLRGINCEKQILVVRPTKETETDTNMKVLTLTEMEEYA